MIVSSDVLGPLSVPEEEIVRFPAGLLGLPECRSFVLLPADREGLYWLQSVEESSLAFVLVDPFLFVEGYSVEVPQAELDALGAEGAGDVAILTIVTLPGSRDGTPTTNLQGPLAVNLRGRVGRQMVIQDSEFGVRVPVDLASPHPAGPHPAA
jgi:flagellar assembly factor FliW